MSKASLKSRETAPTAFPSSTNHLVTQMIIEGDEVGPAQPAFHEPVLARPDPLDAMHMPCDLAKRICSITFPGTEVRESRGVQRCGRVCDSVR